MCVSDCFKTICFVCSFFLVLKGTSRLISTDSEGISGSPPYLSPPQQQQQLQQPLANSNYSAAASLLAVLSDEPLAGQQQQQQNTAYPSTGYAPNESQFEQSTSKAKKDKATKPKAEPIKLKIKTTARLRTNADLAEQLNSESGRSTRRTPTATPAAIDTDNVPAPGTANYELYRTLTDSPSQSYAPHPQYDQSHYQPETSHPALADYHTFNQSPPFNTNIPELDAQNSQSPSDTERGILPKKRRGRNKAAAKFEAATAIVPTPPPPQPEIVTEEPVQKRQRGRRRHDEQQQQLTPPSSSEFTNTNILAPTNQVEEVQPLANLQPKKRITAAAKKHYRDDSPIQFEQAIPAASPPPPSIPSPVEEASIAQSETSEAPAANRRGRKAKAKANQSLANAEQMSQPEAVVAVQRPTRQTRHTANGNMARVCGDWNA